MLNMQDNMEFGLKEDSVPLRKRKCTSNKKKSSQKTIKKNCSTKRKRENEPRAA